MLLKASFNSNPPTTQIRATTSQFIVHTQRRRRNKKMGNRNCNCNCFGLSLTSDIESKPNAIAPSFSSSGFSGPSSSTTRGVSGSSSSATTTGGFSLPPIPNSEGEVLETPRLRVFSFSELKAATKGFRVDTVLGEGGFGRVYKGWVDQDRVLQIGNGKMVVAIKKLNSESVQGFEQWQSEVNFLGSLAHPNLVTLLGYCWEDKELLLVYEYMARGSLENHLFRRSVEPLAWTKRISIALGAAHGLAFLHSLDTEVIYRDFKASNILLDGNYNAKLSDFGLAKFGPSGDESHVTTRVMGTYGYAAPEYVATGHLYVKSDVYGFGVVLLELLTGLRAIDPNRPNREQSLVNWKKSSLSDKRKLKSLMDGRLNGQYPLKAAHEVAKLTAKCLRQEPKMRPSMKEVVEVLQGVDAMNEKRKDDIESSPLKSPGGSSTQSSRRGSRTESGGWK